MNLVGVIGSIAAVISAVFAALYYWRLRRRESPVIELGFAKGSETVEELEVHPQDDPQEIHFRVKNKSPFQ